MTRPAGCLYRKFALDSRLSIAKIRYGQPAVDSESLLLTASYIVLILIETYLLVSDRDLDLTFPGFK